MVPYHAFFPSQLFQTVTQLPLPAAVRGAHPFVFAQAHSPVQVVRRHLQGTRCATPLDGQSVLVHHILVCPGAAPLPGSRPIFRAVRRISPLRPENFSAPSGDNLRLALIRLLFLHFLVIFLIIFYNFKALYGPTPNVQSSKLTSLTFVTTRPNKQA